MELNDFSNTKFTQVGHAVFYSTMGDIDIQTESAPISNMGAGFVHKSTKYSEAAGIIAGLYYDDFIVDEDSDLDFVKYRKQYSPCKWVVFPWHKSGPLNNDCNRPATKGTA